MGLYLFWKESDPFCPIFSRLFWSIEILIRIKQVIDDFGRNSCIVNLQVFLFFVNMRWKLTPWLSLKVSKISKNRNQCRPHCFTSFLFASFSSRLFLSSIREALWFTFAYLHITSIKQAILEATFFDQMMVFCSCFKIMIKKKCWGPPRDPYF